MSGEELKEILRKTGMGVTDIAKALGVPQQNFSQALKAKDVKTGLIEDLAKVLNLPISYFFGEDINFNRVTANGQSSVAAINSNVTMENCDILKERMKHMEDLVAEKERLIQVLMKSRDENVTHE